GNYAIAYFLSAAPDFSYKNYIDIYNVLSEKVKNSYYGKKLFEKLNSIKVLDSKDENGIAEIVKENELITIYAIDPAKKTVELNKKFYERNKYTLIDIWASWCSPCRKTNIDIRAKKDAYLKKGLLIIGFSLDTDFDNWKEAIKTDKTDWLQISDLKGNESPIAKYLKLTVIPSNVLLNSRGEIIARNITLQELDNLLL
ncbi:MAG: TlpA disulfide reductase family protein, partial [Bacteroidota bacterium]|nr:TlpA disulfide reductase family protein [Bacteroidota bacterium]